MALLRALRGAGGGAPGGARGLAASALERVMTVLDGKLAEIKVHQRLYDSELVGEDGNGNKYYEIKKGVQYGRHRYVVYRDAHIDYSPATATPLRRSLGVASAAKLKLFAAC